MMEMTAPLHPVYTNEVTPEYLRTLGRSPFTEQQLAGFSEESMELVRQRQAYYEAHPAIAVYRMATEGSQTRNGGVIQQATSAMEAILDNGQRVRAAQVGDYVIYGDGLAAQIVTGAGRGNRNIAVVGSRLSNGDEIINTPYGGALLVVREGVPMAEDFLPDVEG
jgi:hypothetical protein